MALGGNLKNHFDNWKILSISCKIFLLAHIIIYIILTYLLTILISLFLAFVILSAFNGKIGFNNIFFIMVTIHQSELLLAWFGNFESRQGDVWKDFLQILLHLWRDEGLNILQDLAVVPQSGILAHIVAQTTTITHSYNSLWLITRACSNGLPINPIMTNTSA